MNWITDQKVECPPYLLDKTRNLPSLRVGVVNAQSKPVIESVDAAIKANLIEPVLIGNIDEFEQIAKSINVDISKFEKIQADSEQQAVKIAAKLARDKQIDCVMKGHIHTETFLRGLIDKEHGIRGEGYFTHVFHMTINESAKPLLITDAAIHVLPDEKAMKSIIKNAAQLAHKLGITRPKIALLSASESVNEAVRSTMMADKMQNWAKDNINDIDICGPLAFDLAISPKAAKIKGVSNAVAGKADILVMPNIETGNALFKALVYFKGACSAGIVVGATVPVILTSRADPAAARLASIAIAAILAAKES